MAVPAALSGVDGHRVIDPDARPTAASRSATSTAASPTSPPTCWSPAGLREIAVVAHGGTLRVLSAWLRGIPVEQMPWEPIGNGCIVRLRRASTVHEKGSNR